VYRRVHEARLPAPGAQARSRKDACSSSRGGGAGQKNFSNRYEALSAKYSEDTADEFAKLKDQIDAGNLWELDRHVEMDHGRAPCLRASSGDEPVGGERRRVALWPLLPSNVRHLILDEPTNHLDAESVAWLARS